MRGILSIFNLRVSINPKAKPYALNLKPEPKPPNNTKPKTKPRTPTLNLTEARFEERGAVTAVRGNPGSAFTGLGSGVAWFRGLGFWVRVTLSKRI